MMNDVRSYAPPKHVADCVPATPAPLTLQQTSTLFTPVFVSSMPTVGTVKAPDLTGGVDVPPTAASEVHCKRGAGSAGVGGAHDQHRRVGENE